MSVNAAESKLQQVNIELIDRNPENPRINFRQAELDELQESIRLYGVQVPITVYREGSRYVLIDGERRWRCCLKLNRKTIPALIQEKPSTLTNLLLMFNIHSLREQWDLLTIALKLPKVIAFLAENLGRTPNEREVSEKTGLARGVIRRCKLLMELPDEYKQQIKNELVKPRAQQVLTEDFFIEMERALTTVERAMPEVIPDRDAARKVLIEKYRNNTIGNLVNLRQIPKIARAAYVEADKRKAEGVLKKLFQPNRYSIDKAYADSVSSAYSERDIETRVDGLLERLDDLAPKDIDSGLRQKLTALCDKVRRLLED
jgi:ParB family transcriptional regulator, chromosome partitioning protein